MEGVLALIGLVVVLLACLPLLQKAMILGAGAIAPRDFTADAHARACLQREGKKADSIDPAVTRAIGQVAIVRATSSDGSFSRVRMAEEISYLAHILMAAERGEALDPRDAPAIRQVVEHIDRETARPKN